MGAATMAYVLWDRFLKHNPANPHWPDRDRFVLSAGHGSMLLYSLLHLTGYDVSLSDLQNFRQLGSKTPGHPEHGLTPGVETTTGPLGQGFGNGVGMAIAEAHLAAVFNRPGFEIVNHYTYALVSDGDLMEGVAAEAASLAGHLRLGKLIYLYDDNRISIEGSTDLTFTEDRALRFAAYGWHVQTVTDGNDLTALEKALAGARAHTDQPSLIIVRTHIGYGSPNKQDTAAVHGEPLGREEVVLTKRAYGWPENEAFHLPEAAVQHFRKALARGREAEEAWRQKFAAYEQAFPELAARFKRVMAGELPAGWDQDIPIFPADAKGMATRVASGKVLNAIAARLPELLGGSADLAPSTKTLITQEKDFGPEHRTGRNLRFGVREHAMGSICNGIALHGGLRPYAGTFLVFSDYMRPAIRLAALSELPVIYVFTHDSIGLGEDGPTHQPIEHFAALRAIPKLIFLRPCDANETAEAWRFAIRHREGPVALALTRQDVPTLDRSRCSAAAGLQRGAYILWESKIGTPRIILIASGSEVWPTWQAAQQLNERGLAVRVISMPSWELFEAQPQSYREEVLPPEATARLAVESGISLGWHKYIGPHGSTVTIDHRYGASAPVAAVMKAYGFTVENIVTRALALLT